MKYLSITIGCLTLIGIICLLVGSAAGLALIYAEPEPDAPDISEILPLVVLALAYGVFLIAIAIGLYLRKRFAWYACFVAPLPVFFLFPPGLEWFLVAGVVVPAYLSKEVVFGGKAAT